MRALELVRSAWLRVKALLRRTQLERDLDDELGFHLAMREEHYGAAGLAADAARHAAVRRFGSPLAWKEACRETWTFAPLETLWQDARYAGRVLLKSPGFTAVAVLSLALGIGGNAVMFGLVNAILLRPLPYPAADRLVRLTGFYPKGAVVALQEQSRAMEVAGVGSEAEFNLTGRGEAVRIVGSTVSANLLTLFGRGAGVERQVVGVMPSGFHFPSGAAQLWVPLRLDSGNTDDYWGFGWMPLVARLRPGATLAQAQGELAALIPRIAALFPWPSPNWNADAVVLPLQEDLVQDVRRKLLVLQSAVGIVLLIACANVASLLLSRAAARRKEMALRAALGAGRGRILRQLLTESLTLSLVGGGLGIALGVAAPSGLQAVLPADARGFRLVRIDGGVLAFVTGLSVVCGLVFGLAPAASASRVDVASSLKAGGPRATARAGTRLRSSLIAAEVALAVVLAVGAGLLIRTLWGLTQVDPGFRPEQTLTLRVSPNPASCETRAACVALYDELLRRTREITGVADVAAGSSLPLDGEQPLLPVELEGHPIPATDAVAPLVWAGAVTPSYLRVMRIPLLRGRGFLVSDAERTAPVVLVSAATASRYWPDQDPIGKHVRVVWESGWRTVVGVVGDVRQYTLSGRAPAEITGALYMPYPQAVALDREIPRAMALLVKSSEEPSGIARRMRAVVASVNPDVAVSAVRSLGAVLSSSVQGPRSMMWLFAAFAACALLLAAIGTYGVVSHATAQRTYEIGVRVALGATRRDILGLVVGQSLRLVLAGLGLGIVAALLLGRTLASFLYGVSAMDPVTFAAVAGLLVTTALLAGYLPGRRAAATDPVRALRVE